MVYRPNIITTADTSKNRFQRWFFYGAPGSGKTHLAGTFPAPLFLVPLDSVTELQTHSDQDFTILTFAGTQEFIDACSYISNQIKAQKLIGQYVPTTVVIDNLTEIQNLFIYELCSYRAGVNSNKKGTSSIQDARMTQQDWGDLGRILMHARIMLHDIQAHAHTIWIGHSDIHTRKEKDERGRDMDVQEGTWLLKGAASDFIPNQCSVIAYCEVKSTAFGKPDFYVHGSRTSIWPARCQTPSGKQSFTRLGGKAKEGTITPHYNDIAPFFNLPDLTKSEEGKDLPWLK